MTDKLLIEALERIIAAGREHRDHIGILPRAMITIAADALAEHRSQQEEAQEPAGLDVDKLTDLIAEHLSCTWHCGRVWEAWSYGTMSREDFSPVDASDTPREIAEAIVSKFSLAPSESEALNIGAVLAYTVKPSRGVCGSTIGADGSGDFAVVFLGSEEDGANAAARYVRSLEQSGKRLSNAVIMHGDIYSGRTITIVDTALSASGQKGEPT